METFTIAQAARHLGLSDQGVRKMIGRQELFVLAGTDPVRLDAEHVETVRLLRRESLLLDLTRRRRTPVHLAQDARRVLFPTTPDANLPQYKSEDERRRLSLVSADARQLFGVASLTAACTEDGCRWCTAQKFAEVLGGWAPVAYTEGFRALFDQAPCERCAPGLYGTVMASLAARVHPGRHRLPDARAEAIAAALPAAPAPRPQPAQPAQPIQGGDDGRALISRRRREVQERLTAAKRSGDQRYAIQLRQTLNALTADASRVDARPVSSRPGTLRCGHLLAQNCSCPRIASKRATS
ncbi:hypothetical protein AB0H69_07400 [Streptomyces phaeochromogenes]|uniref:hypothetical protein n=1 Tax=Streptomyces phaeochromogenes TaxID=1923 RepID=UPI00340B1E71